MYGAEAMAGLEDLVQNLADHETVKGMVLPLESSPTVVQAYAEWDNGESVRSRSC